MTSKERIFAAAVQVFAKKGRHGAKMEEIAATAQINKAMIYYLFTSKDNLYLEVITMIVCEMNTLLFKSIEKDISKELSPDKLIVALIEHQFDAFSVNPDYTKILLEAMSSHAEELLTAVHAQKEEMYSKPKKFIERIISAGVSAGMFRNIGRPAPLATNTASKSAMSSCTVSVRPMITSHSTSTPRRRRLSTSLSTIALGRRNSGMP